MSRYHTTTKGDLAVSIRMFPADECLDRFAQVQSMCLGELSVFFGNQVDAKMSQTQIAEALTTLVTSLSRTLTGQNFASLRKIIADEQYVSVGRGDGAHERLTSATMAKIEMTGAELSFVLVECFKYQFSELFTFATNAIGMDSSRNPIGRLWESFKTARNATDQSGA